MSLLPPRNKPTIKAPTMEALTVAPVPPTTPAPAPVVEPLEQMLRIEEVTETTGMSKSMIYKLIAQGKFPTPLKFTTKISVWRSADVQTFLKLKIQQAIDSGTYKPFTGVQL